MTQFVGFERPSPEETLEHYGVLGMKWGRHRAKANGTQIRAARRNVSRMAADVMLIPDTTKMAVNYGLGRVRFLAPVRSGKRVRGHFTLAAADEKAPGQLLLKHNVTVEIEGEEKPALTAEWLGLIFT